MLALMFRARARRLRRIREYSGAESPAPPRAPALRRVSDTELFAFAQQPTVNGKPVMGASGISVRQY